MVLLSCSICVSYPQPHKSLVHTATRRPTVFPTVLSTRSDTHPLCVLSLSGHRHLPQRRLSPQRSSPAQPFSLSCGGDLRSLGDSRTVGIVLTLTDLALSCRSSLIQRWADSRRSLDSSRSLSDLFVLAPGVASSAPIELLRSCFLQLRAHSTFCSTLL